MVDPETKQLVVALNAKLTAELNDRAIGFTEVDLEAPDLCRRAECTIGNLIADAMADAVDHGRQTFTDRTRPLPSKNLCNATLGLVLGGNIRSSIISGPIIYKSVLSTLPFPNTQGALWATGELLQAIFRHSAVQYRRGGFLQVSSRLRVTYYSRINDDHHTHQPLVLKKLEVRCGDDHQWTKVDPDVLYHVAVNSYLIGGGDNYTMLVGCRNKWTDYQLSDAETLTRYIERLKNATGELEGRIRVTSEKEDLLETELSGGKSSAAHLWRMSNNLNVVVLVILKLV